MQARPSCGRSAPDQPAFPVQRAHHDRPISSTCAPRAPDARCLGSRRSCAACSVGRGAHDARARAGADRVLPRDRTRALRATSRSTHRVPDELPTFAAASGGPAAGRKRSSTASPAPRAAAGWPCRRTSATTWSSRPQHRALAGGGVTARGFGVGLQNVERRLYHHYGAARAFRSRRDTEGSTVAELRIPRRRPRSARPERCHERLRGDALRTLRVVVADDETAGPQLSVDCCKRHDVPWSGRQPRAKRRSRRSRRSVPIWRCWTCRCRSMGGFDVVARSAGHDAAGGIRDGVRRLRRGAFELNAVDYLLKPVEEERLWKRSNALGHDWPSASRRAARRRTERMAARSTRGPRRSYLERIPVRRRDDVVYPARPADRVGGGRRRAAPHHHAGRERFTITYGCTCSKTGSIPPVRPAARGTLAAVDAIRKVSPMPGGTYLVTLVQRPGAAGQPDPIARAARDAAQDLKPQNETRMPN